MVGSRHLLSISHPPVPAPNVFVYVTCCSCALCVGVRDPILFLAAVVPHGFNLVPLSSPPTRLPT